MTVSRSEDQEGPASLTIHFASSTSPAIPNPTSSTSGDKLPSKDPAPLESTKSINMKHRNENEILEELLALTKGEVVQPSQEEQAQLRELEEVRVRSEADRVRQAAVVAAKKRQADILAAARQSVGEAAV
jgi:large subunit ribosomal protein MRP49